MSKTLAYGFVFTCIVFTVLGQLLIKWQAAHAGSFPASWPERTYFLFNLMLDPWVVAGLLSAVVAACAWILAMTKLPISVAYPIMSLTYPLILISGRYLFGETITQWRMIGMCLILLGILFVSFE